MAAGTNMRPATEAPPDGAQFAAFGFGTEAGSWGRRGARSEQAVRIPERLLDAHPLTNSTSGTKTGSRAARSSGAVPSSTSARASRRPSRVVPMRLDSTQSGRWPECYCDIPEPREFEITPRRRAGHALGPAAQTKADKRSASSLSAGIVGGKRGSTYRRG